MGLGGLESLSTSLGLPMLPLSDDGGVRQSGSFVAATFSRPAMSGQITHSHISYIKQQCNQLFKQCTGTFLKFVYKPTAMNLQQSTPFIDGFHYNESDCFILLDEFSFTIVTTAKTHLRSNFYCIQTLESLSFVTRLSIFTS